ncbi:MAG: peptidoglycan-binding domain-containing protein [Salinisphaera sp.]|nr:peptidoglycan-binding domain-containing protein [Salinisphaera sp.]
MKIKLNAPALTATALIGLSALALSATALAADNSMSSSGNMQSHSGMSKSGDSMMAHSHMSGSMSKSRVMSVQKALMGKGMNVKTDGMMGPKTEQAIRQYQKKNNLKVTGRPDKATCKSLGVSLGNDSMLNKNNGMSGS